MDTLLDMALAMNKCGPRSYKAYCHSGWPQSLEEGIIFFFFGFIPFTKSVLSETSELLQRRSHTFKLVPSDIKPFAILFYFFREIIRSFAILKQP